MENSNKEKVEIKTNNFKKCLGCNKEATFGQNGIVKYCHFCCKSQHDKYIPINERIYAKKK